VRVFFPGTTFRTATGDHVPDTCREATVTLAPATPQFEVLQVGGGVRIRSSPVQGAAR
jgi:hypothetical protein